MGALVGFVAEYAGLLGRPQGTPLHRPFGTDA